MRVEPEAPWAQVTNMAWFHWRSLVSMGVGVRTNRHSGLSSPPDVILLGRGKVKTVSTARELGGHEHLSARSGGSCVQDDARP